MMFLKRLEYEELIKKVNVVDTSRQIKKKQITKLRSKILKIKYLVLVL